jgi:phage terminase small subunit
MRYPTIDQSDGARAQNKLDFDLTKRALNFARLYAKNPRWTITHIARQAGYSDRGRGAHVRGCELLRDPRVIRAIIYFGGLVLNRARADAIEQMRMLGQDQFWPLWTQLDRKSFKRLIFELQRLEAHATRIEKLYESGVLSARAEARASRPVRFCERRFARSGEASTSLQKSDPRQSHFP